MNETEYPKTETITKGEHTCYGNARGKKREKEREEIFEVITCHESESEVAQ